MINIFDSILAFNETVLLKKLDAKPKNVDSDTYIHNIELLNEELYKYLKACRNGNLTEIADAAGDMFVVVWGIICKHGLHGIFLDNILIPIIESNNTKFCLTREEALQSIQSAQNNNIEMTYGEYDGKYVLFNIRTGKLAKGICYTEPDIRLE